MTEEKHIRTFLALELPPVIRKKVEILQRRLKQLLRGDVRWTKPDGMHLTLKFFGNISERQIAAVGEGVRDITARTTPLTLQVGSVGAFPSAKRPRVIWLGIEGDAEPLIRLQREIDEKLLDRGFEAEQRPFRPHLTLGRVGTPGGVAGLDELVEQGDEVAAGCFTVRELTLLKSELTPRGAIYTALARFPFAK